MEVFLRYVLPRPGSDNDDCSDKVRLRRFHETSAATYLSCSSLRLCTLQALSNFAGVYRDVAVLGTLAVLAARLLKVDAWGGWHWDCGDVSHGVTSIAPLCFVCERHSQANFLQPVPSGLSCL